jgi:putative FmdB family regulatory protein
VPVYDYRCAACGAAFTVFFRSFDDVEEPACERCGARGAQRLPARVRLMRSEESRLESIADPTSMGDIDESDPRSVARWARRLGEEMGEDLGDDFDEAMDSMEGDAGLDSGLGPDGETGDEEDDY